MTHDFSLSGGKIDKRNNHLINEDLLLVNKNFVILMDGATGLGNKELDNYFTSGEWYTNNLSKYLNVCLKKNTITNVMDIKNIVYNSILYMKNLIKIKQNELNINLEKYEIPSCSLLIIYETHDKILLFSLGDCISYIKYKNKDEVEIIRDILLSKLDGKVHNKMKEISTKNNISIKEAKNNEIIEKMLKNNRAKMNSENGYHITSNFEDASNYATLKEYSKEDIEKIFISSDGFYFETLNIDINTFLTEVNNENIFDYIKIIKSELLLDKNWNKYSKRFKDLDDITALVAYSCKK